MIDLGLNTIIYAAGPRVPHNKALQPIANASAEFSSYAAGRRFSYRLSRRSLEFGGVLHRTLKPSLCYLPVL